MTTGNCRHCGDSLPPRKPGPGRNRIYCEKHATYRPRPRKPAAPKPSHAPRRVARPKKFTGPYVDACGWCGDEFWHKRPEARACSKDCANRLYHTTNRDTINDFYRKKRGNLPLKKCDRCDRWAKGRLTRCKVCRNQDAVAQRRGERKRRDAARRLAVAAAGTAGVGFVAGDCRECGEAFVRPRGPFGRPSGFCSRRCSDTAKHAFVTTRVRREIYERDGYVCQLCGEPTDPEAHYLSDRFPSLDHIRCQSWDDEPDHSPENLRTAHRICNSIRGDEGFAQSKINMYVTR